MRLLLVEDNDDDRLSFKRMLADIPGVTYEVHHAGTLREALALIEQDDFDVIVCDLNVPDSRGLETFMRVHAKAPRTPAIVLTGQSQEDELGLEAVRQGAQDYVTKQGLNGRMLVRAIRYAIGRKQAEEKIREAAAIKEEFTSMVSHELRTPLTAIMEGIGIVLDGTEGSLNAEQQRFLGIAKRNVDRLARLIDDVLGYQQLNAGRMKFHIQPHDLNALVKDTMEGFISVAQQKGLELATRLADGLPPVSCDQDAIAQVLVNFLNNAIKFASQGCVTVTTERGDNWIRIAVHNEGPGIQQADQAKLFQNFSQLSIGGSRTPGGMGLGLAISKKIIEAHQGRVGVESVDGQGVTFYATLPIIERRRG